MEKVEAVFKKNSNLEQIWVYGNSYESVLVAVVVPAEVRPFFTVQGLALLLSSAGCRYSLWCRCKLPREPSRRHIKVIAGSHCRVSTAE